MEPDQIYRVVDAYISSKSIIPLWAYLLFILTAFFSAFLGAYAKTKGKNFATKEDFNELITQIEKQTSVVKKIEEQIVHDYLEKRERLKTRREKLEQIYTTLSEEYEAIIIFSSQIKHDNYSTFPSIIIQNRVAMLMGLYFSKEFKSEIKFYKEQKSAFINYFDEIMKRKKTLTKSEDEVSDGYNSAKMKIEECLISEMDKLVELQF